MRDAIQKLATQWPSYGSRRIHAELKKAGRKVSRKRVQRLMREDNLLVLTKRKFVETTDSTHGLRTYPNVAADLEVTGLNQLWVADITYIRLEEEFVYLAVILDAHSRRVIGWHLDNTVSPLGSTSVANAGAHRANLTGVDSDRLGKSEGGIVEPLIE